MSAVHPHACGENANSIRNALNCARYTPTPVGKTCSPYLHGAIQRYTPTPVGKTRHTRVLRLPTTVHPHACGENIDFGNLFVFDDGTPPRLWGKRCIRSPDVRAVGTPPRLWGKPLTRSCRPPSYRYTPTPVGKTPFATYRLSFVTVHPHACGENGPPSGVTSTMIGTPPRLWGKRARRRIKRKDTRYTPTPVGKTIEVDRTFYPEPGTPPRLWGKLRAGVSSLLSHSVHPHACGENPRTASQGSWLARYTPTPVGENGLSQSRFTPSNGTPPRLWGKRDCVHCDVPSSRYTPTPVGKTPESGGPGSGLTGTPPRLWGKRAGGCRRSIQSRYTPTPVGKTSNRFCTFSQHSGTPPRLWGKRHHVFNKHHFTRYTPRLWGKRLKELETEALRRYTPTPVGKTPVIGFRARGRRYTPTPVGKTPCVTAIVRVVRYTPTPVGKTKVRDLVSRVEAVHPHACGENLVSSPT